MSCSKEKIEVSQTNQPEEFAGAMSRGGNLSNFPDRDLLCRFEFNGNLKDTTGRVASGTSTTGRVVYTSDRKGAKNSAIRFNETYGVDILGVPLDSNMSISFWMKYDMTPGDFFITFVEGSNSFGFQHKDNNSFQGSYWDYATPTNITSKPIFNSWHHMAATRDSKTFKFYIDGKLVGSTSLLTGGLPPLPTSQYNLGYCFNAGFKYWKGNLDDLRIYKRVITANEVNTLAAY
jgi:hypothetical protein